MHNPLLENWICTTKRNPCGEGTIRLYLRQDAPNDKSLALDYWCNNLVHLEQIHSSPSTLVERMPGIYFKRFRMRNRRDRLKHLIRNSRALRACIEGLRADGLGFEVPEARAVIEFRRFGIVCESILITTGLPKVRKVRELINCPELKLLESVEQKRVLLNALGNEVGRWHKAGLYHGDMRTSNIQCRYEDGQPAFFWLDHERNRRYHKLPNRKRIHNLMQLNMEPAGVTLADRMRVWHAYAEATGIDPGEHKHVLRQIINKTRKRWKKRGWLKS